MDKIRLGLVGCGGMGTRHLYGLRELVQSPFSNVELCAVCDIRRENAELAALEAEKLMGVRPEIFTDLEEMARAVPDLTAVDVVTDPSVHHNVVCQALDLGLHVMVEKPMAITVKACRQMIEAAEAEQPSSVGGGELPTRSLRSASPLSVGDWRNRDALSRVVPCAESGERYLYHPLATS